jgi:hypothetical protein
VGSVEFVGGGHPGVRISIRSGSGSISVLRCRAVAAVDEDCADKRGERLDQCDGPNCVPGDPRSLEGVDDAGEIVDRSRAPWVLEGVVERDVDRAGD